ncbi:MAG TPA: hypothetical protein VK436_12130 [Methanocella sp.]|nr:hypothetical protein [Methanocella sp.]
MYALRALAALSALAILLATSTSASAAGGESGGVHYSKMVVEPTGTDLHVTLYYNASFMTKVFSILFGTGSLKPAITDEVSGFGNISTDSISIQDGKAVFTAHNQTTLSGDWYMYDHNAKFRVPVDQLEIRGRSIQQPIIVNNASSLPDFFYQS